MHNVYIFGAWHQGFVSAGVLAENEYIVTCVVNTLEEKLKFDSVELPVFEPGLQELVAVGKESGRIQFAVRSDFVLNSKSTSKMKAIYQISTLI